MKKIFGKTMLALLAFSMIACKKSNTQPEFKGISDSFVKAGSEFVLDVDTVIMALGTRPNPLIKNTTKGLEVNRKGGFVVDEDGLTSREAVYAGGDAVTGAATVISAMGAGKLAAASIDKYLSNK